MHSSLDFAGYIDMSPLIPTWVFLYHQYKFSTTRTWYSRTQIPQVVPWQSKMMRCPGNVTIRSLRRSNSISAAIFLFRDLGPSLYNHLYIQQ